METRPEKWVGYIEPCGHGENFRLYPKRTEMMLKGVKQMNDKMGVLFLKTHSGCCVENELVVGISNRGFKDIS